MAFKGIGVKLLIGVVGLGWLLHCAPPPEMMVAPVDPAESVDASLDAGRRYDAGQPGSGPAPTTIRVHYPTAGRRMFLRGSEPPLSWFSGTAMRQLDDDSWEYVVPGLTKTLEVKPRLEEQTWSLGPNFVVQPGTTVDLFPRFHRGDGEVRRLDAFTSTILGNTRAVWVYVPPTYIENTSYRAPVVYMHDGQNLFDPGSAFGGNEWQVDETMNRAANDGSLTEALVVGPENAGAARIDEYTPTRTSLGGGRGALYLRFLVEELKPAVDREFRTKPGREHTVVMGSSLGGLISVYAGLERPDVFGAIGAMSPSTWWDNRWALGAVSMTAAAPRRPIKVYVDSGNAGSSMDGAADTRELAQRYRSVGYRDGETLKYLLQEGGAHTEVYWAQRLPEALRFLIGPGR